VIEGQLIPTDRESTWISTSSRPNLSIRRSRQESQEGGGFHKHQLSSPEEERPLQALEFGS